MDINKKFSKNSYTNPLTMTFHLIESQKHHKEAKGDFTILLNSIQTACKYISSKVRKAGMVNLYGNIGATNITGDIQKKLDVLANEVFINTLKSSNECCVILSEEEEEPIILLEDAKYIVAFDPLDGSSNIDANVTIGSIFGIWKRKSEKLQESDMLQTGDDLIASGYCVYGSSTQLVTCIDKVVNGYTLDPSLGEFILTHPNIKIPETNSIYSINEGNSVLWDKTISDYVLKKKSPPKGKNPYSLRYIGSMVADVHRTLLYGGIFMYPADSKSPEGKLRLMYECNPLSLIIESAGGKASTGKCRIMELVPKKIHQRCSVIMGSRLDVEELEASYKNM
jgi:fructose-1,6-bisphosphatase I